MTHMAHTGRAGAGRAGRAGAGRAGAGRAGRVLAHTAHGPSAARPARPCALVLRGSAALRPGAAPWQRRGRGGRAERLGPQLRSVRKQFLFFMV